MILNDIPYHLKSHCDINLYLKMVLRHTQTSSVIQHHILIGRKLNDYTEKIECPRLCNMILDVSYLSIPRNKVLIHMTDDYSDMITLNPMWSHIYNGWFCHNLRDLIYPVSWIGLSADIRLIETEVVVVEDFNC